MNIWFRFTVLFCCLALTMALYYKRNDGECADKYPLQKCKEFMRKDQCHTLEARQNCGTSCEACGEGCIDWHTKCKDEGVMEELCSHQAGAFMICARSCGLCIDN